jgi:hypothetical protein
MEEENMKKIQEKRSGNKRIYYTTAENYSLGMSVFAHGHP